MGQWNVNEEKSSIENLENALVSISEIVQKICDGLVGFLDKIRINPARSLSNNHLKMHGYPKRRLRAYEVYERRMRRGKNKS